MTLFEDYRDAINLDLDPLVIPMVKFFNDHGLHTEMSCQGHSRINMSMFWVSFAKDISEAEIISFQSEYLNQNDCFCSEGHFAQMIYLCDGATVHDWRYMAANPDVANHDLNKMA